MIGTSHHMPAVSGNYGEGRGTGADACKSKEDAQEVSLPDDYEFDEDLVDEYVEELASDSDLLLECEAVEHVRITPHD